MFDLKSIVNKLGEHFFEECNYIDNDNLDIYGYIEELYGVNQSLLLKKVELFEETKTIKLCYDDKVISTELKTSDATQDYASLEDLLETDELNDTDNISRSIIIKGECNGKQLMTKFEIKRGNFSFRVVSKNPVTHKYEIMFNHVWSLLHYKEDDLSPFLKSTIISKKNIIINNDCIFYDVKPANEYNIEDWSCTKLLGSIVEKTINSNKKSKKRKAKLVFKPI